MVPTRIPKFPAILRCVGLIMVILSVIGFLASVMDAYVGRAMEFDEALLIASCSLAGGILGWLLWMKKKVYLCRTCGCTLKRV